jgi:predicted P-loop ATPase
LFLPYKKQNTTGVEKRAERNETSSITKSKKIKARTTVQTKSRTKEIGNQVENDRNNHTTEWKNKIENQSEAKQPSRINTVTMSENKECERAKWLRWKKF